VRLRHARPADAAVLVSFDVGSETSPWLDEVREIVTGLVAWRDARSATAVDRQVVVLESDGGEIVGVYAHEATSSDPGDAMPEHRYWTPRRSSSERQRMMPGAVRVPFGLGGDSDWLRTAGGQDESAAARAHGVRGGRSAERVSP